MTSRTATSQGVEGEVAIPAVLFREAVEHVGEDVNLAGQGKLHGKLLLLIDEVGEARVVADETLIGLRKWFLGGAIHEQADDLISEVIAGGAMDGPVRAKFLAGHEDFFDQQSIRPRPAARERL